MSIPVSTQSVLEQVSQRLRKIQQEIALLHQQEKMASKFSSPTVWRSVLETPPPSPSERLRKLQREQDELTKLSTTFFTNF